MLLVTWEFKLGPVRAVFQWAPTLGGECYLLDSAFGESFEWGFNGHPPLGVNATEDPCMHYESYSEFQWAPTLGGECYRVFMELLLEAHGPFQWAPTLGGECYSVNNLLRVMGNLVSMGTHPWG